MLNFKPFFATNASLVSMNVPHKRIMDKQTFERIFCYGDTLGSWEHHVEIFFSDIPVPRIEAVMHENSITPAMLYHVFEKLPQQYQNSRFKEYINERLGNVV